MSQSKPNMALIAGLLLGCSTVAAQAADPAPVASAASPVTEREALRRANLLQAKMTLEEKVGQISQHFDIASLFPDGAALPPGMPKLTKLDEPVRKAQMGALLFVHDPEVANTHQKLAV